MTDARATETDGFVFHSIDRDFREQSPLGRAKIVERIKRDGLWIPVDYSIISSDIFFWGGSSGSITVVCDIPHKRSLEYAGTGHTWERVRLLDPKGEIYPPHDKRVPDYIREIYGKGKKQKAAKGYRRVSPGNIKAIIEWTNGYRSFASHAKGLLEAYEQVREPERSVVDGIKRLADVESLEVAVIDRSLDRSQILEKTGRSLTRFRLVERYEELLCAIKELRSGKLEGVNSFLADYFDDIDRYRYQVEGDRKGYIFDEKRLEGRLKTIAQRLSEIKTSFDETRELQKGYQEQVALTFSYPELEEAYRWHDLFEKGYLTAHELSGIKARDLPETTGELFIVETRDLRQIKKILDEDLSDNEFRGRLEYIKSLLPRPFKAMVGQEQSPPHGNIDPVDHTINALRLLDTSELSSRERVIARTVLIFHDIGKVEDSANRDHPRRSAKLIGDYLTKMDFQAIDIQAILNQVRYHDALGEMTREFGQTMTQEGVLAVFPDESELRIHKAVVVADVSSIPGLTRFIPNLISGYDRLQSILRQRF